MSVTVERMYMDHIKTWTVQERMELIARISSDLSLLSDAQPAVPRHSLLELRGLGAEIWKGVDVKQYIDELRDEWERPSDANH